MFLFDMNQVCTSWDAFQEHIATGFSRLVRIPIDGVRPIVHVTPRERAAAASLVRGPYAVLSMHSNSNPPRVGGEGRVKDWPLDRFAAVCAHLRARGIVDIVAVGSEFDAKRHDPQWRSLHGLPIKVVAALLQEANVVITLENGLGHLSHAVDAPMVMIYSNIVPLGWANPVEARRCEVLYGDPRQVTVEEVTAASDRVMRPPSPRVRRSCGRTGTPMRIAFFDDVGALGGGELWVLRACRHLADRGHQVTVVSPWRSALFQRALAAGVDSFSYLRMNGIPVYEPVFEALRRRNIDVLHCTVIGMFREAQMLSTMVDRLNRGRRRRPAALVLKTGLPPMRDMTPEHYGVDGGPAVAGLHVVSEHTRNAFLQWSSRFAPSFVEVAREGIELERYAAPEKRRGPARARWGLGEDETVVTSVARLGAMKGLDNLLLAAQRLIDARPRLRFLIAGDGDQRQRLLDLRDHLGLGERVTFLGHVDDVPDLLAASDVLCHPALAEGLPNAIVEAMASGVPVVASEVGGIPEVVRHEDTGLLVPPHDVKALAGAIERAVSDTALSARMAGSRARRPCAKRSIWTRISAAWWTGSSRRSASSPGPMRAALACRRASRGHRSTCCS